MGEKTLISWCDHTFNPWIGCTKVGPACDHCYAETWGHRFGVAWGPHGERRRTSPSNWRQPLAWDREAAKAGKRPFVFCASLADVFDNHVPINWRTDLLDLIDATPRLVWLLLTKRPQNIQRLFLDARRQDGTGDLKPWPRNAAIGCTVVTQAEAGRDIPVVLNAKAALNPAFAFVSMEPLLAAVDLRHVKAPKVTADDDPAGWHFDALSEGEYYEFQDGMGVWEGGDGPWRPALDWVITGGESGPHARPSHPDWFRRLRDQCAAAGVPFEHKQNGEWAVAYDRDRDDPDWRSCPSDDEHPNGRYLNLAGGFGFHGERVVYVRRIGKAAAGHLLDGVEHRARPAVRA